MKKSVLIFFAVLTVGGCSPSSEEIHTVSDYLDDGALRVEQLAKCRDNPGELADTPNCRNASAADFKARLQRMDEALGE